MPVEHDALLAEQRVGNLAVARAGPKRIMDAQQRQASGYARIGWKQRCREAVVAAEMEEPA